MGGNCNLENVYQANIFPKVGNVKEKIYIGISLLIWKFSLDSTTNLLLIL